MTAAERSRRYRARKAERERPWRQMWQQEERKQKRREKDRKRREKRLEEEMRQWREKWRSHTDPETMRPRQQERQRQREQAERNTQIKADADKRQRALMRKLTKVLGLLGSDHEGERDAAARQAESLRKELGMSWEEIAGGLS